jgi:phosphoglycolate phosphatase-like HAD superfamily hydrolase
MTGRAEVRGRPARIRHLVWDWNSTLWDDSATVVASVNVALARLGLGPVPVTTVRDHYTRPWKAFYERLVGRSLTQAEWLALEAAYHEQYNARLTDIGLAHDGVEALRLAHEAGVTQSILSMWRHDLLVDAVRRHNLDRYLSKVEGRVRPGGGPKAPFLADHLRSLGVVPNHTLLIGDALDDLDAARAVGCRCVLYDGGTHHRTDLLAAWPLVAGSLREALILGGVRTP